MMGEKVTNGTFEAWSSATDADNWTESLTGASTVNREDTEQYAGTYCLRFDVDASKSLVREGQTITLVAGNPYLLSVWSKDDQGSGEGIQIGLVDSGSNKWLREDGEWRAIDSYDGGIAVSSTTTWTQTKIPFTAHASYTSYDLSVKNYQHSGGNANALLYVDNISVDDALIDHETESIELADAGGSGRQTVYDSVSVKDDFEYYLASSTGKVFEYSEDYLSDDGSVILCRWRSKTLDFADQIPECLDSFKQLTGVKLVYKDLSSGTNVTIYVSTDGGQTWEHETKSLGTGTNEILSANYHFIKTGEYFIIAIEHVSTDKKFLWLHMEADIVPLGPYVEI